MYTNIGWIIGSILMAFSVSPVMFAVGRFCSGASCGMNSVATPTYNGEIATIQGRGPMGTLNQYVKMTPCKKHFFSHFILIGYSL